MPKPTDRSIKKTAKPAVASVTKPVKGAAAVKPAVSAVKASAKHNVKVTSKVVAKLPSKALGKIVPKAAPKAAPKVVSKAATKSAGKPTNKPAKTAPEKVPKSVVKASARAIQTVKSAAAKKPNTAAKPKVVAAKSPTGKPAAVPVKVPVKVAAMKASVISDKSKPVANKPVAKNPIAKTAPMKSASAKPAPAKAASAPAKKSEEQPKLVKSVAPFAAKPVFAPKVATKPIAHQAVIEKPALAARIATKPVSAPKVVKMSKDTGSSNGSSSGKHRAPANGTFTCPYDAEELGEWRKILLERRHEISSDIGALEKDAMEAEDGHTTPLHAAERGSDADLQDVSLGLAGEEKDLLWQIDRALRKIDVKSPLPFGICEYNKQPISKPRLQLIPWTPLSIEGATHMEENNMIVEDLLMDD